MPKITTLIDKLDSFEIIRDKIAAVLLTESQNQQALATTAGKPNPQDWALKVYTERAAPWDNYAGKDVIVNVWFDTATPDESSGGTVHEQVMRGTFNVDVIGFANSEPDGTGHIAGDKLAALTAARGLRLVRNILMASAYTYLDLRPLVGKRMPSGITSFQPQFNTNAYTNAVGVRLSLDVRYSEFSPQYVPEYLEELTVTLQRAEDGHIYAVLEYDFTNP
jgi:hypothetical protein